jgi:hypothetical protein
MTPLYSFHESCSPDGLFGEWDVWLEGPHNLPARVRVRTESNQVHDEEVSVGSEWMMLSSRAPA